MLQIRIVFFQFLNEFDLGHRLFISVGISNFTVQIMITFIVLTPLFNFKGGAVMLLLITLVVTEAFFVHLLPELIEQDAGFYGVDLDH